MRGQTRAHTQAPTLLHALMPSCTRIAPHTLSSNLQIQVIVRILIVIAIVLVVPRSCYCSCSCSCSCWSPGCCHGCGITESHTREPKDHARFDITKSICPPQMSAGVLSGAHRALIQGSFRRTCDRLPATKSSPWSKSKVPCSGCWTYNPPFPTLPPSPAPTPASPSTPSPAPALSKSFFLRLLACENVLADRGASDSNMILSIRATMMVEYFCWHRSSALAST